MAYIKSRKHASARYLSAGAAGTTVLLALGTPLAAVAQASLQEIRVEAGQESVKSDTSSSSKATAPLLDTAKSVTVIPQQIIRETGATSLAEALRTTPGVTFGVAEGGNPLGDQPFLRGYNAQASTFVDGLRDIAPSAREVFNLETIEVVKGSDSSSGGRNGAGGTINLYTKKPTRDNFFSGSVGLGTDKYHRETIDFNRAFGESGAFRLNLMDFGADIAGREGPSNKRWGIAPSVSWGLGTPTRVTLQYFHLKTNDMPDGGVPYLLPPTSTMPAYSTVRVQPTYGGNRNNWYGVYARDFRKDTSDSLTAQVEHDISADMKVRNITRLTKSKMDYIWTQPDDSKGNAYRGLVWRRFNSSIREIETAANATELSGRLQTGSVKHTYALGLEISREKAENDGYTQTGDAYNAQQTCPGGAGVRSSFVCTSLVFPTPHDPWLGTFTQTGNPTNFKTNTTSLYAFDTMAISPEWSVNAGLRLDRYKTSQTAAYTTNTAVGRLTPRSEFSRSDTLLNYQIGAVFKPAENGSIYASIGTSSTPAGSVLGQGSETQALTGTVNGRANTQLNLKPERNRTIEVGTKWDVLDKRLSLTGALFQIETTNARVTDPVSGNVTLEGDKQVRGLELGFSGNLTREVQVFGGYALMNSEGKNLGNSTVNFGTAARPRNVTLPNAATGQMFANTPKHSASLWTSYKPTQTLTLGLGLTYQSAMAASYAWAAGTGGPTLIKRSVPGYTRLDAMLGYAVNKNFNLQLNVQNLTNRAYYAAASSPHYAILAAGRSVTLTGNFTF